MYPENDPMTITQLIDILRTIQAIHGTDTQVWLGQASGPNLGANCVAVTKHGDGHIITLYPASED